MTLFNTLDINEISNIYVMYNELCNLCYQKKNYNSFLIHFNKLSKYFEDLYSKLSNSESFNVNQAESLKIGFLEMKKLAGVCDSNIPNPEKINIDSLDKYEQILYSKIDKKQVYKNIARLLYDDEIYVSALSFLQNSMRLNPENYEDYKFLGVLYDKINDKNRAILCFEKYIENMPSDPLMYNAVGELYSDINLYENFEKKIDYFKKAIDLDPKCKIAIKNLAYTYRNADNIQESLNWFEKLVKLNPENDDYCNYAHVLLKNKDFENGFKYFETRFDRGLLSTPQPKINAPKLTKEIDFSNKTILVHYEQGYGDTVQFCRYLSKFKPKKIIFLVQDELVDLLKFNLKNVEVVCKSTSVEDLSFDYYIMLMNLPMLLSETVDSIPLPKGYIKADLEKIDYYKKKYFDNNFFKIGVAWSGALEGLKNRNIPLSYFYPLTQLENVCVYSFQKGFDDDLDNLPDEIKIENLAKTFNDFSDTSAALNNVDLVITTDNVIANLAGAMGKKTFLLLFEDSDWRWFDDTERTPWYESVKIFRGKNNEDSINLIIKNIINNINSKFAVK